ASVRSGQPRGPRRPHRVDSRSARGGPGSDRLRRRLRRRRVRPAPRRRPGGDRAPARHRHGVAQRRAPGSRRVEPPPPRGAAGAVTRVIEVPATFDDRSFEQFAAAFGGWPPEEKVLLDARVAQWASPYGLLAMLTAGQALAEGKHERPLLTVPTSDEVKRYWARAG